MSDETEFLLDCLREAVKLVYQEERPLLHYGGTDRKGLEQAFVFRVGIHLHELLKKSDFESYDLDVEYTKNHGEPKRSEIINQGIRPDLLIHQRNTHNFNVMAVEFKGHWEKDYEQDLVKLKALTSSDDDYRYHIGVFVLIGSESAEYCLFRNGA